MRRSVPTPPTHCRPVRDLEAPDRGPASRTCCRSTTAGNHRVAADSAQALGRATHPARGCAHFARRAAPGTRGELARPSARFHPVRCRRAHFACNSVACSHAAPDGDILEFTRSLGCRPGTAAASGKRPPVNEPVVASYPSCACAFSMNASSTPFLWHLAQKALSGTTSPAASAFTGSFMTAFDLYSLPGP